MSNKGKQTVNLPDDIRVLVENPAVKEVKLGFWYAMGDGRDYTVTAKGADGVQIGSVSGKKDGLDLMVAFQTALPAAGYTQTESYIDPRGAIDGGATYTRK